MIETILELDTSLFLWLNAFHNSFFDDVMYWVSHKFLWVPFYAFLAFLLVKNYGWKKSIILVGLVIITFAITNTISTEVFKKGLERLRPCHHPEIASLVHIVDGHCGGQFGFFSSHASNVFGLAMLFSFFLSNKVRKFTLFIFGWAFLVAYSRIYLGVHYPLDIFCGAIFGVFTAWLVNTIYLKLISKNLSYK